MTVSARKNIYKDFDEQQKEDVQSLVFLPEGAYPKTMGRPSRYDFLYVWVSDIDEDAADRVKKALWIKTDRPVFYYPKTRTNRDGTSESGYVFLLPWRSRKDGKALPNKLKFFEEIKNAVAKSVGEMNISIYGKVPEEEAPEESAPAESVPEELETGDLIAEEEIAAPEEAPAENEREKEKIRNEINSLKGRRTELKKQLDSVERMGKFMPTYKSKKRTLQKELERVDLEIRMLEMKLKSLT